MCSLYPNTKVCAIEALITWLVCFLHCNTHCNTRCNTHCNTHCNTLITWLVCFLHLAGAVLPAIFPIAGIIQLALWSIRQQSCTREQICTCKIFGQKYQNFRMHQNFRRYRFVPRYRIFGAWFTKPVVSCRVVGEMFSWTVPAECRQHTDQVQTAHRSSDECFNRTSFCISARRTHVWAIETVFAKGTITL